MIDKKEWKEFQKSGLLWWTNKTLHLFGWAIVFVEEADGSIAEVFPARVSFRGFQEDIDDRNFKVLTQYLDENAHELNKEVRANNSERHVEVIDAIMDKFPEQWRGNWCESGACACMGCVNGSGSDTVTQFNLTKEEHQRWVKWKEEKDPNFLQHMISDDANTEFDVILTSFGKKKIQTIKTVRNILGVSLLDAKTLVENTPISIVEAVSLDKAKEIKKEIEEAGGSAELK